MVTISWKLLMGRVKCLPSCNISARKTTFRREMNEILLDSYPCQFLTLSLVVYTGTSDGFYFV